MPLRCVYSGNVDFIGKSLSKRFGTVWNVLNAKNMERVTVMNTAAKNIHLALRHFVKRVTCFGLWVVPAGKALDSISWKTQDLAIRFELMVPTCASDVGQRTRIPVNGSAD